MLNLSTPRQLARSDSKQPYTIDSSISSSNSVPMSRPSKQRHLGNYEAVDHISSLPDALLSYVLSFIPTKYAVRTSILSKRWNYIWTKVPTLELTERPVYGIFSNRKKRHKFKRFVDKVLLKNDVSYLQCLRFYTSPQLSDINPKSWLDIIARREIREIDIRFVWPWRPDLDVHLPKTFFSRERLVVLKLEGKFVIDSPKLLHLPNLETIHLVHVCIRDDEFIKKLSSSCPLLKILHIVQCFGITSTVYVESLTLHTLKISIYTENFETPLVCQVIKAPNLRYLDLKFALTQCDDICDLSSLVEANLRSCRFIDGDDNKYACQLLRKVSGVTTLRLGTSQLFLCVLEPPIFSNLTLLEVDDANESVYIIMNCAPKLKSLIFREVNSWDSWYEPTPEPKCISQLENIKIGWFLGTKDEVRLVAYFLKAASVLKEMKISLDCYARNPNADYRMLLMLPKSSATCQVIVDHDEC